MEGGVENNLLSELSEDLTAELSILDKAFDANLLLSKIKSAMREVKNARNYPDYYTEEQIEEDMNRYYSNIRSLALYDYNKIGAEFENSHSENGESRSYMERNKLFAGIIPLAR